MPALVNTVVEKTDLSKKEAEKRWEKAKEIASEQGFTDDYEYIVGVFKKSLGNKRLKKLGWKSETVAFVINKALDG